MPTNPDFQCAFVNTTQRPKRIKRLGQFKYSRDPFNSDKFRVYELCEVFYPHPDAPENANISILQFIEGTYIRGTESLIEQAIKACSALESIVAIPEA